MKPGLRRLVRETRLSAEKLVMPLFVEPGDNIRKPIPSMPGQFRYSPDELLKKCRQVASSGVGAVLLFGIPERKDDRASRAYESGGVIPESVRLLKKDVPELTVITDVCLCGYMRHGHCGVVRWEQSTQRGEKEYRIDNDATVEYLVQVSLAHARAGADMLAPSDMMDGRVTTIRDALDENGFQELPIMSYAAKYASAFYGPFRSAVDSAPSFGDRMSYQLDPANAREALQEIALDIEEGADIIIVKPALAYGDVIRRAREEFNIPIAAYCVSGEYAMVKAAAEKGWVSERETTLEMLTCSTRAGADIIITYWAEDAAGWLGGEDVTGDS